MRSLTGKKGSQGVAFTIVIVIIVVLLALASFTANFGYNKKRAIDISSGRREVLYYRAQAGIVDAHWRIRVDDAPGCPGCFATNPAYTLSYNLDVDGNGVDDTKVDIGAEEAGSYGVPQRKIESEGL